MVHITVRPAQEVAVREDHDCVRSCDGRGLRDIRRPGGGVDGRGSDPYGGTM